MSLHLRHDFLLKTDMLEIMLNDEHLMSILFTISEIAFATLGLAYQHEQDYNTRQPESWLVASDLTTPRMRCCATTRSVVCSLVRHLTRSSTGMNRACNRLAKFYVPMHLPKGFFANPYQDKDITQTVYLAR